MKLLKLKILEYKNLQDVEIDFSKSNGMTLVVGTNGSGKSNLLEVLSAIFSALYNREKNVHPNFRFELEYVIDNPPSSIEGQQTNGSRTKVKINNYSGNIDMHFCCLESDADFYKVRPENYKALLPDHVIAIYSGEEKRLWENYYFQSYDNYNKQYMEGKVSFQQHNMVYLNHYYWNLIASILLIHEIDDYKNFVINKLGINGEFLIHCEFDVNKLKRNKNERAKQILQIINPQAEGTVDVSLETYKLVKNYCGYEADMFFNMLVLTLYKDYKIITNLTLKCNNAIDIRNLSEGEKKLLLVYGAINLLSGENLYLLDEPDAHLHEGRKREIFDLLQQDINNHFVVSSHSPTLTKLFDYEHVILLEKANGGCNVCYGDVANTISKLTDRQWDYINHTIFLDTSRPLVVVEGSGDVEYIRKAVEVFSALDKRYDILKNMDILHCGGAQNMLGFINELKHCIPQNKRIIILFDRDEAGGSGLNSIIRKNKNSKKGKQNSDNKTYHKNGMFCLKLPRTDTETDSDFLIEDYFKKDYKKSIAQMFLDNVDGTFNALPSNLKQSVKNELYKELPNYSSDDMEGFKVLLDKLYSIVSGEETIEEF